MVTIDYHGYIIFFLLFFLLFVFYYHSGAPPLFPLPLLCHAMPCYSLISLLLRYAHWCGVCAMIGGVASAAGADVTSSDWIVWSAVGGECTRQRLPSPAALSPPSITILLCVVCVHGAAMGPTGPSGFRGASGENTQLLYLHSLSLAIACVSFLIVRIIIN